MKKHSHNNTFKNVIYRSFSPFESFLKDKKQTTSNTTDTTKDDRLVKAFETIVKKQPKNTSSLFIQEVSDWDNWTGFSSSVQGFEHMKNHLPCQDYCLTNARNKRPFAIVCDGAGSARVSDIGSKAIANGLKNLFAVLEPQLKTILDKPLLPHETNTLLKQLDTTIAQYVNGLLENLSEEHNRPIEDFNSTLLLMIGGKENAYWFKVGDGAIVVETLEKVMKKVTVEESEKVNPTHFDLDKSSNDSLFSYTFIQTPIVKKLVEKEVEETVVKLTYLGENNKGDFANQTFFFSKQSPYQSGFVKANNITAFFAMSDGAEFKLVGKDDVTRISKTLSNFAEKAREDLFSDVKIARLFYDPAFTTGHNGDDCSLAFCVKN